MEASASAKARVDPRVLMTAYNIAYNEVSKVCACGVYLCVKLPMKTLLLCWRTQVFVICLPFRCTYRTWRYLKHHLVSLYRGQKREDPKKSLQEFIQCDIGEREKLLRVMHELKTGSMVAVKKMNVLNRELCKCRKQLVLWNAQAERQKRQMAAAINEEKRLLKVVIGALKRLRTLKSLKEDADDRFKGTMDSILNFSKNFASKESYESPREGSAAEINALLKVGYKRLHKQTEQMRHIIERKRSFSSMSTNENFEICLPSKDSSTNFLACGLDGPQNLLNLSMGTLDTIIGILNAENLQLKKRLKVTNDQLENVKNTSLCLNEKILNLEMQLDDVMNLLKSVEADRDDMRERLLTLQGMIEEEEIYLNDDVSLDDSYSEICVNTKDFRYSEIESISPVENFDASCNESDDDFRDPKSLELSLSR